jgi:hypothetical protein
MANDEFPELTHQAKCVLINALECIDVSRPYWNRRFAAALLREAVKQAAPLSIGPGTIQVVRVADLLDIADNLHALPPPPPTREQMEEALQSLVGRIDFHPESQFAQEAAILAAGIAHYCKVQP